jgi:hypothetical protein
LCKLSGIWNNDTVHCRPIIHCGQHNGSPLQTRSTARGVGLERDKVSRYKKIYRFSATYDVTFSLRCCATPQRRIFMVHKFSSEFMFSLTPDPPRFIVRTATNRLKMETRYVIQFSATSCTFSCNFNVMIFKISPAPSCNRKEVFSVHPILSPANFMC